MFNLFIDNYEASASFLRYVELNEELSENDLLDIENALCFPSNSAFKKYFNVILDWLEEEHNIHFNIFYSNKYNIACCQDKLIFAIGYNKKDRYEAYYDGIKAAIEYLKTK